MPRPGTKVALEYTSTRYIDSYEEIARDVLTNVLDLDYDGCFISDESSLLDFPFFDSLEEPIAKIKQLYGVDVSDIKGGNLVDIFERIRTGPAFKSSGSLNRPLRQNTPNLE